MQLAGRRWGGVGTEGRDNEMASKPWCEWRPRYVIGESKPFNRATLPFNTARRNKSPQVSSLLKDLASLREMWKIHRITRSHWHWKILIKMKRIKNCLMTQSHPWLLGSFVHQTPKNILISHSSAIYYPQQISFSNTSAQVFVTNTHTIVEWTHLWYSSWLKY